MYGPWTAQLTPGYIIDYAITVNNIRALTITGDTTDAR